MQRSRCSASKDRLSGRGICLDRSGYVIAFAHRRVLRNEKSRPEGRLLHKQSKITWKQMRWQQQPERLQRKQPERKQPEQQRQRKQPEQQQPERLQRKRPERQQPEQQQELQQQEPVPEQQLLLSCRKQPEQQPTGKRSAESFSWIISFKDYYQKSNHAMNNYR